MTPSPIQRLAYFISPHGFGHAARASAVMTALHAHHPQVQFEIFTKVPAWFFEASVAAPFTYHSLLTDIGLVQQNSLRENLNATIEQLNQFLPFPPDQIQGLARQLIQEVQPGQSPCRLVLCDIAPMGIAVAQAAGIPAILIENFTWDWIYEGYPAARIGLEKHIDYLAALFDNADYHIQTKPVCDARPVDLTTSPVSRKTRQSAQQIRQRLRIPAMAPMVVMTMGGVGWNYTFLDKLSGYGDVTFVVAGVDDRFSHMPKNLIVLDRNSGIFHPDLINAANAVVGKVGYSTLAEVYQAGLPFGYVARPNFRESPHLTAYIEASMPSLALTEAELEGGDWLAKLPDLLALPAVQRPKNSGADQAARFIGSLL